MIQETPQSSCAERTCANCEYHEGFSWVCFNGDSPHVADFTNNADTCTAWSQKAQKAERQQKGG